MQTEVLDPENGSPPSDGVADVPVREEPDHTSSGLFHDLPKEELSDEDRRYLEDERAGMQTDAPARDDGGATPDPSGLDL